MIAATSKQPPVLLFNEADALFGKRRNTRQTSDQTDNRIQNILLEELENFSGILIATTNLEESFDEAFERRFLYRIKIGRPDVEVRAKIWASKFPNLKTDEVRILAMDYELSGGQMEKIAQKLEMAYILKGTEPCLSSILEQRQRKNQPQISNRHRLQNPLNHINSKIPKR